MTDPFSLLYSDDNKRNTFNKGGNYDPFTLSVNICVCVFENNRSNGNKMQMQRMS